MDNVAFHRTEEVQEMLLIRGFEVKFLPAYSPFFNPIENMFAQWKNIVKTARAESEIQLTNAINNFQTVITAQNCASYVAHVRNNCLGCLNGQVVFDN
jgi:transposase